MICKDCLRQIKNNLRKDDILALISFQEENAISHQCSLSRETIQKKAEMTLARTANSLMRLEAACLVQRSLSGGKTHKYHMTPNGISMLNILEEEM